MRYREESDFAESDENIDDSFTATRSSEAWRWGSCRSSPWRRSPVPRRGDALGAGGVSAEFGETSLGGAAFRVFVVVGTGIARRGARPAQRAARRCRLRSLAASRRRRWPARLPSRGRRTTCRSAAAPASRRQRHPGALGGRPGRGSRQAVRCGHRRVVARLAAGPRPPQRPYEATIEVHITEEGVVDAVKFLKSSNPAGPVRAGRRSTTGATAPHGARACGASTKVMSFTIEAKE